jgi:hypothetical protein
MTFLCLFLVFFCYLFFRSLVSVQYMQGQKDLLSGVWNSGSTLKCMLVNSYTPSVTSDKHYSDITTEVSGTGYTSGGNTLTSVTVTETAANSWGTTWAASTAYSLNSLVIPASANSYVYNASIAGTSAANVTPTAGTNASPIVVTANGHGYQTGNMITISGVTGNTNMNGTWIVVVLTANTYNLMNSSTLALVNGNGTFGGTVSVAPAWPTVRGETITDGTVEWTCAGQSVVSFSCGNPTWTSATITATGAIVYYSSGTGSTSTLIAYLDFGGSVSSTAGTFTVTIPSNGIYYDTP